MIKDRFCMAADCGEHREELKCVSTLFILLLRVYTKLILGLVRLTLSTCNNSSLKNNHVYIDSTVLFLSLIVSNEK